jgi:hypothetical protein
MDYFQEFKKQQELSEISFGNLFSKSKQQQPEPEVNKDFSQAPDGSFVFGGKSTAKELNTPSAVPFLKEFNWSDSKLNFLLLPGTEFHAKKMNVDLKTQTITYFNGTWESGPFIGKTFQGTFRGSSFQGNFSGPYTDWEAHPTAFVDGLFYDSTKKGILGMPNTLTLNKAKNRKFNIITIPPGFYLQFRSVNGITGYIKMIKRLDYVSSSFQMEIMDGFAGQKTPRVISLPWNYFRQNWKFLEVNPKNPRNIGGLIHVPEGDFIQEMYISAAPATFNTPGANQDQAQFDPEKKYGFNLEKLPYLNIKSLKDGEGNFTKADAIFKFDSPQEYDQFKKILSFIGSGTFSQDIKNIAKAVKYGEVDGFGSFKYLTNVFNNAPGKNIFTLIPTGKKGGIAEANGNMSSPNFKMPDDINNPKSNNYWANRKRKPNPVSYNVSEPVDNNEAPKFGTIPSMQRLNDFVKFFVENIVNQDGSPNQEVQNLIINRLKSALGTETLQKPANSQGVPKKEPGMDDSDLNGTDIKDSDITMESVRNVVRGIISDNF